MKRIFTVMLLCLLFLSKMTSQTTGDHPRRIIGYFTEWRNGSNGFPTYFVSDIPWDKVTHINYAFAQVNETTNEIDFCDRKAAIEMVFEGQDPTLPYKGHFNLLTTYKKRYTDVKTLISVGGWAASRGFYTMTDTAAGREIFANSCIEFIRKYGFDGIDIDYEYPTSTSQAGNPNDFDIAEPRRKVLFDNYVELMRVLREKVDAASRQDGKKYLLTIAAPASSWILGGMQLSQYAQYLDYLNMMTYDFHGGWNGYVGHNSALLPDDRDTETKALGTPVLNTDWAYRYFRGVLPPSKINIGIPYYTRGWKNVTPGSLPGGLYGSAAKTNGGATGIDNVWHDKDPATGLEMPAGSNPLWHVLNLLAGRTTFSYTAAYGVTDSVTGTYQRYFDDISKVPYVWNDQKRVFLSLEDEVSMKHRVNYVINKGIGGIMMWELAGDYEKKADGEYYMGSTLTTLAYNMFKTAGPADDRMSITPMPSQKMDFRVEFKGNYAHPNYNYTLLVHNNTATEIPAGWVLEFDMPLTTTIKSGWGATITEVGIYGDFRRYKIVGPGWKGIAPGSSASVQGMAKLCFSGGPRNAVLNGFASSYNPNPGPQAPVVTAPASVKVKLGQTVSFKATATDADGQVVSMKAVEGFSQLAQANGAALNVSWVPTAVGKYQVVVTATDDKGMEGNATVNVEVIEDIPSPPVVEIISPANNEVILTTTGTADIKVAAKAIDLDGDLASVTLGTVTPVVQGDLYTFTVAAVAVGAHTYEVVATDAGGRVARTTVTVTVKKDDGCKFPKWEKGKTYETETVCHKGRHWKAQWWTTAEPGTTGQWGAWKDLGPCGPGPVDTEAPSVPTGVKVSNVTSNSAVISWTASADNVGVKGYKVYDGTSVVADVTSTSATVKALKAKTAYTLTVAAYDAAGNESVKSIPVKFTTPDNTVVDKEAPTVPANLKATKVAATEVALSWSLSQDNVGVAGYKVYQGGLEVANVTATSAVVKGLTPKTAYSFSVSAYDAAGNESLKSAAISVTTLDNSGPVVEAWKVGVQYKVGDIVTHKGNKYRCTIAHTSISTWAPDLAFAVWSRQ